MRYEKGHKDATRRHIVAVAGQRFREDGVGAVGVAAVMADAGLTHGGFYAHFRSKDDLVREALGEALAGTLTRLEDAAAGGGGVDGIIDAYLAPGHRDDPGHGCAVACLTSDIARHAGPTREAAADYTRRVTDLIATHLPAPGGGRDGDGDGYAGRETAEALFALMVGTLQLARMVPDSPQSDRILLSGASVARMLAAEARACPAREAP
ncbi:MAG: TetR/AcrR family transcriptional regulator [Telmatospirillum sp.]|nr:TetR/AcrR family transcriptional regulator [Telmatospirillum sp.]